jgi:hypothetical protein
MKSKIIGAMCVAVGVCGVAVPAAQAKTDSVKVHTVTVTVHPTKATYRALAKRAGLTKKQTRIFVNAKRPSDHLGSRVVRGAVARLNHHRAGASIASAGYPFPNASGSLSSSGSQLNDAYACFDTGHGGSSNSFFYLGKDPLLFIARLRGSNSSVIYTTTSQVYSTYVVNCWTYARYYDGFNVQERITHYGREFGHGNTLTGNVQDGRTGMVPYYASGDSRNGLPQWVCNDGSFVNSQSSC